MPEPCPEESSLSVSNSAILLFACCLTLGACHPKPSKGPLSAAPAGQTVQSDHPGGASAKKGSLSAGAWTLRWDPIRGTASRPGQATVSLYDHEQSLRDCIEGVAEMEREQPGCCSGVEAYHEGTSRVIAVAGALVSIESHYGGYCGGAHSFQVHMFQTLDLSEGGKPASLASLFGSAARAVAVRHRALTGAIDDFATEEAPWSTAHFAFKAVRGEHVVVRLGLAHAVEADAGTLGLFDLLLPVPEGLREPLLAAQGAGRLLGDLAPDLARLAEGVYQDEELHSDASLGWR